MCARVLPFLFLALLLSALAPATRSGSGAVSVAGDCNRNGAPDEQDVAAGLSSDGNGDGKADECCSGACKGADCNENDVEDSFDIVLGNSNDCNCNGVPDECDAVVTPCDPPGRNGSRGGAQPNPSLPWDGPVEGPVCGLGSPSVGRDDLELVFAGFPQGASVVVVAANLAIAPGAGLSFAKGALALQGPVEVFAAKVDALGRVVFAHPIAQAAPGFVQPGDTLRFQCLFEDAKDGVVGFTRSYLVLYED